MFKKRTRPQTVVREISLEKDDIQEGPSASNASEEEEPNLPSVASHMLEMSSIDTW